MCKKVKKMFIIVNCLPPSFKFVFQDLLTHFTNIIAKTLFNNQLDHIVDLQFYFGFNTKVRHF